MQKRGARMAVVALLLAIGGAAAFLSRDIDRRFRTLDTVQHGVAQQIDAMAAALAGIAFAQHGYVGIAPAGASAEATVTALLEQLHADAGALRAVARSADAAALLASFDQQLSDIASLDERARRYAREGQTFLISDLLSGSMRPRLAAVGDRLGALREAEAAAIADARAVLRGELWTALGGAAALWTAGLLLLALGRAGQRQARTAAEAGSPASGGPSSPEMPAVPDTAPGATVDLAEAAALCTALSRIDTTAALPDLLARAATLLDARGLIVWMGAGDQLFAAAAHGYEPRIVARLAPISRTAANATAIAWRTGSSGTVAADAGANGAIVAPMFSPSHCIGVLAIELRHAREADGGVRAIVSMIAAQLGSVLGAWPAASSPDAPARATG